MGGNNTDRALIRRMERASIRAQDPCSVRHSSAYRMIEAVMRPACCAKILDHPVQTFLTSYARFIDSDADTDKAAIWATIHKSRPSNGANNNLSTKANKTNRLNGVDDGA